MTFNELKKHLTAFGLWKKTEPFYNPDGTMKDFEAMETGITKYSSSERVLILALTDLYHNRDTVFFNELINTLDRENIYRLIQIIRQIRK